jgi:hypothetical protein
LVVALAGCSLLPTNIVNTNPADGVDSDVFTIAVGDCLNDGGAEGEISSVPIIECDEPHDTEVFDRIILDDGEYPGKEAVIAKANAACESAFDSFVGIAYAESAFDFSYYYPTAASWATGDREILCLIFDPAGKIETGSLSGVAR